MQSLTSYRRDKNLNLFNIMVRKRLKKEDEEESVDSKEDVKKEIKSKGLVSRHTSICS